MHSFINYGMNKKLLITTFWLTLYGLMAVKFLQAQNPDTPSWEIVYEESFTDEEEGELPEDFLCWMEISK